MIPIEDYIQKPQAERQSHLKLSELCDERGGMSSYFKGLLAYHVETSIPSGKSVHVCHACHNDACSNVGHLYWGTPSENRIDFIQSGKSMVRKADGENMRRLGNQKAKCKTHIKSEDHKKKIAEAIRRKHKERIDADR